MLLARATRSRGMPWVLVLVGVQACGGSAPKAETPATPGPAEPGYGAPDVEQATTVDDAIQALDRAEQRLSSTLGGPAGQGSSSGARWADLPQQPAGPITPAPVPAPTLPVGEQPAQQGAYGAADRCATACQAFASMQRAAGRLCGLAGEDDPRCERAMGRVARAAELVRNACPECSQ
jgi:hypothetical protein